MKINFTRMLFAAIFLLAIAMAHSQTLSQNPRWTVPGKSVQVGTSPNATVLPTASPGYGNTYSGNPSNIIVDNGVPLAFIVDGVIYNANGYKITDTKSKLGRTGVTPGHAEVCVVPDPSNCNQYYVFSSVGVTDSADIPNSCVISNSRGYVNAPVFQLIDMHLQDPTSGVPTSPPQYGKNVTPALTSTYTAQDLYLYTSTPASISDFTISCSPFYGDIHYAASRVRPDGSRLLFLTNNFEIIVYKLSASGGISYVKGYDYEELSDTGAVNTLGGSYYGNTIVNKVTSELEIYEDSAHNQIKVAFDIYEQGLYNNAPYFEGDVALVTFPYTYTTTAAFKPLTSQVISISSCNNGAYADGNTSGIEFSPDGNTVYVLHDQARCTQDYLEAYSFANPTATPTVIIPSSSGSDFVGSQIELGNDGAMYVLGNGGTKRFGKLTSPNSPNAANFTDGILAGSLPSGYFGTYSRFWLPDQIDQEVYGAQFTASTACCLFYGTYDKFNYNTASGAPTWTATAQVWTPTSNPLNNGTSSTVTIGAELRVATGYTVTIRNMTIKFSPQATLIVEGYTGSANGGELILKKCTLDVDTRCESTLWPGVRVWGDSIYSRTNTTKGYIYIDSMSVITNAWVGCELGYDSKYAATYGAKPADTVHCGGANIFCQNSSFINNQRDIVFDRCQFTTGGTSSIYTSTLTTTASLLGGAFPTKHIQFKDYKINALLKGLTITCGSSLSYNVQDTAIYAYNSNFNLDLNSSPTVWNSISNMMNGIYATNSGGTTTFTAKHTVFANNIVGENIEAVNNFITENDTFKIYNRPNRFGSPTNCSGIYADNCTGYYIQDNYFTRNSTGFSNLYGVVANNSGPYANAIFRNEFKNLYKGSQAQYRNYTVTGQIRNGTGLLYLCNIFDNATITAGDIYVPATGSSTNVGTSHTDTAGVGNAQGNPAPAGGNRYTADNQFSHTSGGEDFYIESGKSFPSVYEYYASSTANCTASTVWRPATTNSITPTCYTLAAAPDCSTGGTGHRSSADPLNDAKNLAAASKITYDSLMSLFDGGSTTDLINLVKGGGSAAGVLNSLTNAAPYLSNAVLINYMNSNYPAGDIYNVLSKCSPLTAKVRTALASSNLSAGLKSQLASQQNGYSPMDYLDQGISAAFTNRHLALNEAIRILVHSHTDSTDIQAHALMKERALELPARVQVITGIDIHDSAFAAQGLSKVAAAEGQSNFVKLHTILLTNLNKTAEQIMASPVNANVISAMDNDSSDRYTYLKANILLHAVGRSNYQPYYQESDTTKKAVNEFISNSPKAANTLEAGNLLYSQPNPFKDQTTIKASISQKTDNAYVLVTDMLGKEVGRYKVVQGDNEINFSGSETTQQIFFCTLVIDGVKIKTNKLVMIK